MSRFRSPLAALAVLSVLSAGTGRAAVSRTSSVAGAQMEHAAAPANAGTGTERGDARAILERAIQAKGGQAALRAVKTIVMNATMIVTGSKPVTAETTSYIEYPDRFRQDARLPAGEVIQVYAAGAAWMKDQAGVHDVPEAARENLAATVSRDIIALLLGAADGKLQVELGAPSGEAGGHPADTLRITGASGGPVELAVDRGNGLIAIKRYTVQQPGSIGKVPTEEWYSDYRAVGGVQVAYKTVVRRGEAVILEQRLTDFRTNVPIESGLFSRPAK